MFNRLIQLREKMREQGIDAYLVYMTDEHMSEYVGESDFDIRFLTGFTGTNAVCLVTEEESLLWTDGRYYIQAEKEMADSGTSLMRYGSEGVPKVSEYLRTLAEKKKKSGAGAPFVFGFDGKKVSVSLLRKYEKALKGTDAVLKSDIDLISEIWTDRPAKTCSKIFVLEDKYSGKSYEKKLKDLRKHMKEEDSKAFILTDLTDIAWLFNMRADDISCTPVFYAYSTITRKTTFLYVQKNALSAKVKKYLEENDVKVRDYQDVYVDAKKIHDQNVIIDPDSVNTALYFALGGESPLVPDETSEKLLDVETLPKEAEDGENVLAVDKLEDDGKAKNIIKIDKLPKKAKKAEKILTVEKLADKESQNNTFIEEINFTTTEKTVKNETEIENTKKAHLIDAVAMCKFLYQIKCEINVEDYDEYSIAQMLDKLRAKGEGFIELSFDTIAAYGENAALMHYTATKEKKSHLQKKGFLLVDSGGTYYTGTTDITRTIALGELTDEEKHDFTLVLKAAMRLKRAKFPDGVSGQNLDILSRGFMWDLGLDYRCGTGHGVGHISNVHEGPNAFRYRIGETPMTKAYPLKPGMITTDEPGLYYEGGYGIRTENELLCVKDEHTEYGQFYSFENLTLVPIDKDAIIPSMLTDEERRELNAYHARVYEKVSPLLTKKEAKWLKEATSAI